VKNDVLRTKWQVVHFVTYPSKFTALQLMRMRLAKNKGATCSWECCGPWDVWKQQVNKLELPQIWTVAKEAWAAWRAFEEHMS
jgi:hypothetical protein